MTPISDPVRWAFYTGVQLMQAGRASLLLREGENPVLVVAASVGIDDSIVPEIRIGLGEGIAGMVAARGGHFFGASGNTTFLSVPVRTESGVEGVLNLTERVGGMQFGEEHIAQAKAVAAHIARLMEYDRHAVHDVLPNVPLSQRFDDMLTRELARSKRTGSPFGVVSMRLHTKQQGSRPSNRLIRAVEGAIQAALRRYDYVSYLGDGEFALLLGVPFESANGLGARISRVVAGIARTIQADVLVNIGMARCPDDGINMVDLLATARRRMRESNPTGQVSHDGPGMVS